MAESQNRSGNSVRKENFSFMIMHFFHNMAKPQNRSGNLVRKIINCAKFKVSFFKFLLQNRGIEGVISLRKFVVIFEDIFLNFHRRIANLAQKIRV